MNPIVWATRSLQRRGLKLTLQICLSVIGDVGFDLMNGTETRRKAELQTLAISSGNKVHGVHYQASKAAPLTAVLTKLKIPRTGTFVDYGSGKGRVLLLALASGFPRVVGVEFSPELCVIARRNLAKVKHRLRSTTSAAVIEGDAAEFAIGADQTVFYLYNPFGAAVLERVVANIRRSVERVPRRIWVIYNTPVHREVVEAAGIFDPAIEYEARGNQFAIFTNERTLAATPKAAPAIEPKLEVEQRA